MHVIYGYEREAIQKPKSENNKFTQYTLETTNSYVHTYSICVYTCVHCVLILNCNALSFTVIYSKYRYVLLIYAIAVRIHTHTYMHIHTYIHTYVIHTYCRYIHTYIDT